MRLRFHGGSTTSSFCIGRTSRCHGASIEDGDGGCIQDDDGPGPGGGGGFEYGASAYFRLDGSNGGGGVGNSDGVKCGAIDGLLLQNSCNNLRLISCSAACTGGRSGGGFGCRPRGVDGIACMY